nr:hypothetical protein [Tanacetum cinerariifolium]
MTVETHSWSSSAHQELHKIVKDENFPIVNQVDACVQNFGIQFLKEAAKFVGDFKSLAKEADESLAKHKALEWEIERLLRAVFSQDIMSVVQNISVVDISNLQTKLERTKKRFENCIIKRRMNMLNFGMIENAHLKATYKNPFDSISVSRTQTKTIIASLQNELQNTIYENAKLRAQLFKKVSLQKDNKRGTSRNTKFAKQSILGKPPKVGEIHALSKPVTSNSISTPQESKVVKNEKVIAPGTFRINPFKTSREEKHVPNNVRASVIRSFATKNIKLRAENIRKQELENWNCHKKTGPEALCYELNSFGWIRIAGHRVLQSGRKNRLKVYSETSGLKLRGIRKGLGLLQV